jgi:hypothetical protein
MLHTFFFVLSFITDYHGLAEVVRGESTLGLINVGVLCSVCGCLAIRSRFVKRAGVDWTVVQVIARFESFWIGSKQNL